MWTLALKCDGCGDLLAHCDAPHATRVKVVGGTPIVISGGGDAREIKSVARDLKAYADAIRWERALTPDDGETWYCPTRQLARGGGAPGAMAARAANP